MVPFCGRIRGGTFPYWVSRAKNENQLGVHDPIHGDGWKTPWQVVEQTQSQITLAMTHDKNEGGFPFHMRHASSIRLTKCFKNNIDGIKHSTLTNAVRIWDSSFFTKRPI